MNQPQRMLDQVYYNVMGLGVRNMFRSHPAPLCVLSASFPNGLGSNVLGRDGVSLRRPRSYLQQAATTGNACLHNQCLLSKTGSQCCRERAIDPFLEGGSYVWLPNRDQIFYASCQIRPTACYWFQWCGLHLAHGIAFQHYFMAAPWKCINK
jgi:hypothetical protein